MRNKLILSLNGMGTGLLATLVVGTIMEQIGTLLNLDILLEIGGFAKVLMAAAIGVGVTYALDAKPLVIFAGVVTAMIGAGAIFNLDGQITLRIGEPAGAYLAAVATAWIGKQIIGKTKVDIILVPMICLLLGGIVAVFIAPVLVYVTTAIGAFINHATDLRPLYMGAIISVTFCLVILSPLSSAALAVGLGLDGLAAGAAAVGCASSMVGFAIASYGDNGVGGLISQGIGTSKIQFGNAVKNPYIILPTVAASFIAGPASTALFKLECNSLGAGMGSSGFVGQIQTIVVMGTSAIPYIIIVHFLIPAMVSFIIGKWLMNKGYIRHNDMLLLVN